MHSTWKLNLWHQVIHRQCIKSNKLGSSIYDVHKKIMFLTPLPCPLASTWAILSLCPLWTSTCDRHEMHITLLKWLVQWPSGPKAEIRIYDCNLFKTVLLVIYITNLYCRRIFTFYSIQLVSAKKDTNFFAWEEDKITSVRSTLNSDPLPSVWTS